MLDWSSVLRRQHSLSTSSSQVLTTPRQEHVVSKTREGKTIVSADTIVACSVTELLQVLRTRSNEVYTMTMRELYGRKFVFGRIAHSVVEETPLSVDPLANVDVKIAKFAGRHALTRDEQWCFVEGLHSLPADCGVDTKGFAVTRTSMNPDDVLVGRPKRPVGVLHDVKVAYVVLPAPGDDEAFGPPSVLVSFKAEVSTSARKEPEAETGPLPSRNRAKLWRGISQRALTARVKEMAGTMQVFPRVIRRRRLCAQVFINVKEFRPSNTSCVCCSQQLPVVMNPHKKQCHLCGLFACKRCSSLHAVIRGVSVRVCNDCMKRVDDAIYDNLPAGKMAPATVVPDMSAPSGKLERLLRDALADPNERLAAKTVIRAIVDLESDTELIDLSDASPDESYLHALHRLSDCSDTDSVASYELANPTMRDYPIEYAEDAKPEDAPRWPVPSDDAQRLEWYEGVKPRLDKVMNCPELELICKLASKELECSGTGVTVISGDRQYVLASDIEQQRNTSISRTHTICAHTILEKQRPLLLPHPEADVRFSRTEDIRSLGFRFYFGFPITSSDGVVIGTFCSIDFKSHSVTQTQYSVVSRLARCASRIVQQELTLAAEDPLA